MGILGFLATKAAKTVATGAVMLYDSNYYERVNSFKKKMLSIHPRNAHLFLKEYRRDTLTDSKSEYEILDMNENILYKASARSDKRIQKILVHDVNNNAVAAIYEKYIAIRSPFSMESSPTDYEIWIKGKRAGEIQSRGSFGKNHLNVNFNGWKIYGKTISDLDKIVNNKGKVMATYTESAPLNFDSLTFIDYEKSIDEVLIVTLSLVAKAYTKSICRKV